jgi:hypothetical protein
VLYGLDRATVAVAHRGFCEAKPEKELVEGTVAGAKPGKLRSLSPGGDGFVELGALCCIWFVGDAA